MRREGFGAMLGLLFVGGCASVLDLESRNLVDAGDVGTSSSSSTASSSGSAGASGTVGTSSSSSSSSSGDSGTDAPTGFTACVPNTGPLVHALFNTTTGTYRYNTTGLDEGDFKIQGSLFRLAPDENAEQAKPKLLLLKNSDGSDFLVSTVFGEGALDFVSTLGHSYDSAYPGTVNLSRWQTESPSRHRVEFTDPGAPWTDDDEHFFVCPK